VVTPLTPALFRGAGAVVSGREPWS
jgi:hypothetical protein